MAKSNLSDGQALQEFLTENPYASVEEIKEFALKRNLRVSFSGPSSHDPTEPGFNKFLYTEEDIKDMGGFDWEAEEESARAGSA